MSNDYKRSHCTLPSTSRLRLNVTWPLRITIVHRTFEWWGDIRSSSVGLPLEIDSVNITHYYNRQQIKTYIPAFIWYISHRGIAASRRRFIVVSPFRCTRRINGYFRWWWWIKPSIVWATLSVNIIISSMVRRWPLHCPPCLLDPSIERNGGILISISFIIFPFICHLLCRVNLSPQISIYEPFGITNL